MNIRLGLILSLSILLTPLAQADQPLAEDLVGRHQVGAFVNFFEGEDEDDPADIEDGVGYGGLWGYRYSEDLGFRLRYEELDVDRKDDSDTSGHNWGGDLLYYPGPVTYLALGLRDIDMNESHFAGNLGLGHHFYIGNNFSISPEANVIHAFEDSHTSFEIGIGINYFFGGTSSAVAAAPVDADQDGVNDDVDQCLNTPLGVKVDARGCALDSDGDGVPDSADQCPETPAGYPVDASGCALDSDGDGVPDGADQCPDTPATDKVDANGCSLFTEQQVSIRLEVNFANNSSKVPQQEYAEIEEVANFMRQYANTSVEIQGHTSASGSAAYNKQLSQKRADAVAEVLVSEFGIDASRVTANGYGEEQLIDTSGTREAAAVNRRVEAVIQAMTKEKVQR